MNRKTREGFYTLWTLALLVRVAVSLGVLIYTSVSGGRRDPGSAVTAEGQTEPASGADPAAEGQTEPAQEGQDAAMPTASPEPTEPPVSYILAPTEDAGQEYIDKMVFLGDSTTYGLRYYDVLPNYQVWTPSSGTLSLFNVPIETIEYFAPGTTENPQNLSIADCAATGKPEYLVITLGINGVAWLDETQFKQYYRDLIISIQDNSPDTKIICQSIYPVIDSLTPDGIKNDRIDAANQWIQDLVQETGVRYLNTQEVLKDSTGNLIVEYNSGDGIHFMPDGLRYILQYIRTHAWL